MKFILLAIALLPLTVFAQQDSIPSLPKVDGKIVFERVIQLDSLSKEQIYTRIKSFMGGVMNTNIGQQVGDKEGGVLVYRGTISPYQTTTVRFLIKDQKAKVVFTDIIASSFRGNEVTLEREETAIIEEAQKRLAKKKQPDYGYITATNRIFSAILDAVEKKLKAKSEFDF